MQWDFEDIWCGERKEGSRAYCTPDDFVPISPLVYHNDGNGHFTEVSQKIGIALAGKGLGIAIADYDRMGTSMSSLRMTRCPEFLYHNRGNGTFEEVALPRELQLTEKAVRLPEWEWILRTTATMAFRLY